MTDDEVVSTIERMTGAWPFMVVTNVQLDVWIETLTDTDPTDGKAALEKAVRTLDQPPSIAWFLAEVRSLIERRTLGPKDRPELEAAPTDRQGYQRFLAAAREALERNAEKVHWHGGPEPCPVCGGLRGTIGDQR